MVKKLKAKPQQIQTNLEEEKTAKNLVRKISPSSVLSKALSLKKGPKTLN
jgi:hypothetical protein